MTEEQFEALVDLMQAIAYVETGRATHQQRCKGTVENAEDQARLLFDLPLKRRD